MDSQQWLVNISEIRPGASAILGGNHLTFFTIQSVALFMISVSILASLMVILQILINWRHGLSKIDMPVRFPMYLAVIDCMWEISNFACHAYLISLQTLPEEGLLKQLLCIITCVLFAWTQLFRAGVSIITYSHVVHGKQIYLGKWEWRLHMTGILCTCLFTPTFYSMNSFGICGYWMGYDASTVNGLILGGLLALSCSGNAVCTVGCYHAIKRTVVRQNERWKRYQSQRQHIVKSEDNLTAAVQCLSMSNIQSRHSAVLQCLTTHVWISACLYCPLAFLVWAFVLMQILLGVVEPVTSLLIVIVANSSGWANACGYFYNERVKRRREIEKRNATNLERF